MTIDTKGVILDAAESLFANNGFGATSLRSIVGIANVNLAAVNYHFRTKEGLIEAVFARRIGPLNETRLQLLEAVETEFAPDPVPLERVLEALVGPALRLSRDPENGGEVFMRLLGRAYIEPDEGWQKKLEEMFGQVVQRFLVAMRRSLPDNPESDFFWRINFAIGAMAHTMCDTERVHMMSNGKCDPNDVDEIVRQLVAFLTAGMRAPAVKRD